MRKLIPFIIAFTTILLCACNNSSTSQNFSPKTQNEDPCFCEPITAFGEISDSTFSKQGDSIFIDGGIDISLSKSISKVVTAELKGKATYSEYDIDTRVLVNKVIDVAPEITKYEYYLWKIYCEYVKTVCQSEDLTGIQIRELKMKKLNEIDAEIKAIFRQRLNLNKEPSKEEETQASKAMNFQWKGIGAKAFLKKLEAKIGLKNNRNAQLKLGIVLDFELSPHLNSKRLFKCYHASLIPQVKGQICGEKLDLPIESALTGESQAIKRILEKRALKYIDQHSASLTQQFALCID